MNGNDTLLRYSISTSKYGLGSESESLKRPLVIHQVVEKFGDGAPEGTIFISRIETRQIAPIEYRPRATGVDYVTTCILWLDGMEPGNNKGEKIDCYETYIYTRHP